MMGAAWGYVFYSFSCLLRVTNCPILFYSYHCCILVYESVEAIKFLGYYVLEFLVRCLFGLKNLGLTVGIYFCFYDLTTNQSGFYN